jgi:hypothetical protein
VSAGWLLCELLLAGAAQAFSDKAEFALKKVDRLARATIVAEASPAPQHRPRSQGIVLGTGFEDFAEIITNTKDQYNAPV